MTEFQMAAMAFLGASVFWVALWAAGWHRAPERRRDPPDWLPEPGDLFTVATRGVDTRPMPSAIFRALATDTRVIVAREVPINGVAYPHPQVLARSQYEAHPVGESVARALEIKG